MLGGFIIHLVSTLTSFSCILFTLKFTNTHSLPQVMAQKCGCDETCEYSPGKINIPSVPKGQNTTMDYVVFQQWVSLSTIVTNLIALRNLGY